MLYIKESNIHGFGCFSNESHDKGHLITCNVIVIPKDSNNHQYTFPWNSALNQVSIVLSELTYCNASNDPNLEILYIDKDKLTTTF